MVNWLGLAVPIAYLVVLVTSLATFSSLYRSRKVAKAASLAPWFPPNLHRDIYLSLLHLDPADSSSGREKTLSQVPDSVLKAALLRRAVEDVHRIVAVRNAKQALSTLLQRGSVGDDLWQRFLRAETEMEEEIKDVVMEANAFAPNWGQTIFQSASEMAANSDLRNTISGIQYGAPEEIEWWEQKRADIQAEFMQELDEENTPAGRVRERNRSRSASRPGSRERYGSDSDGVLVDASGQSGGSKVKKRKARR